MKTHREEQERWITVGRVGGGTHLVIVHTWVETGPDSATVRIISARRPTKAELRDYKENQ